MRAVSPGLLENRRCVLCLSKAYRGEKNTGFWSTFIQPDKASPPAGDPPQASDCDPACQASGPLLSRLLPLSALSSYLAISLSLYRRNTADHILIMPPGTEDTFPINGCRDVLRLREAAMCGRPSKPLPQFDV